MSSASDPHPLSQLDETVHQRARLGILAILVETRDADFTYLKRALQLTDGNLGRHLEVLVTSGYVELRKGSDGRRSRTWARITPRGKQALLVEVELLRGLLASLPTVGRPASGDEAR
ncbi:transcriptional regulator [Oerskovia enterophila]|uniref:transcriptional regulator n=1 Tax=Oerskovia enterophila TaxID=43678 RepID=UPI0033954D11